MCRIKINFCRRRRRRRRGGSVICLLRKQLSTKVFEVSEYDGCMYKRAFWQISSCRIVIFLQLHPTWIRRTSWQSSHVSSHLFIHAIQGLYFGSSVNIIRQTIAISRICCGFWHRHSAICISAEREIPQTIDVATIKPQWWRVRILHYAFLKKHIMSAILWISATVISKDYTVHLQLER